MARSIKVPIYAEYDFDLHHIGTIDFDEGDGVEAFIEKLKPVLASVSG